MSHVIAIKSAEHVTLELKYRELQDENDRLRDELAQYEAREREEAVKRAQEEELFSLMAMWRARGKPRVRG